MGEAGTSLPWSAASVSTVEELTHHLRWNDGVLEQGVSVTYYEAGKPTRREMAWRPVPSVAAPRREP